MAEKPRLLDRLKEVVAAFEASDRNYIKAAAQLRMGCGELEKHLVLAAEKGLLLHFAPTMPGFAITKVATDPNGGQHVTQKREHGETYTPPDTHLMGKVTMHLDAEGRVVQSWPRYSPDDIAREAAMKAAVAAFSAELPRATPVNSHLVGKAELANQYTVTDYHFGLLSWGEETGVDWDLKIAEKLWLDWFAAAIRQSPDAHTAILAQLGDLLHFDSLKAITPAHGHILDADSRFAKIVRVVIRCLRAAVRMLLEKHEHVHIIMADANHDEASEVWLREMFAAHYDSEPRITVDRSPGTYYAYEWGDVALFYHHGHKKKMKEVDKTFAGRHRVLYGKSKFAYGHTGHLHSDHVFSSELGIKVEQHETLTAPSSYEAHGGYYSRRSAKVITYHRSYGEVGRITLIPEMVSNQASSIACDLKSH